MQFVADKSDTGQLICRVFQANRANYFDSVGLLPLYPDGVCRSRRWEEKDLGVRGQLAGWKCLIAKRGEVQRSRTISVGEWYELISQFKLDAIELALKR